MFSAAEAARMCGGKLIAGSPEARVTARAGVTIDSRGVAPGGLFVAVQGTRDGHDFVPDAVAAGAAAVLVSRPLPASATGSAAVIRADDTVAALQNLAREWRRRFSVPVAAITGSVGKTTTKEMLRAILSTDGHPHVTAGNLNNHLGLPLTLLGLRPEHDACVVELGINHAGEMDLLTGIALPTLGLVTAVGEAHLEGLGDRTGVAREKGRLFAAVARDGVTVINLDDALVRDEAARHHPARRITYSATGVSGADVEARLEAAAQGPWLTLRIAGDEHSLGFFSAAAHQACNAAAATAMAHAMGVKPARIAAGLAAFTPPPMRGGERETPAGVRVIDDTYNANPASMLAAVRALVAHSGFGRRIAVLGDMLELGARGEELHRELGREVARLAPDRLICTGPLSRHMAEGANALADVRIAADAPAAARHLDDLQAGDVVLVKGSRGMRMEQVVAALGVAGQNGKVHA
ncbi:MAG: UDP-N-acetylmuramoyl-tripeptide--D-alanyl-D-alanine ligase [Nitrospirota bacterium]|nr:UDP-N-acetylmuramoyl-tripeptide--D-alanyl-D-alanine ligase [Nitrospirota bacterium]